MPTWESQGSHRYYRDADVLFFEVHDMFCLPDIQRMYDLCDLVEAQHGYILAVFDGRHASGMTADARRYVAKRSRAHVAPGATAIIGASLGLRTVVHLLRNAIRLFGQNAAPIHFCSTAEEATDWLASQRAKFTSHHPPAEPRH